MYFPTSKITNICTLIIGIKELTPFQQVLKAISNQQLTGKLNRLHGITAHRNKDIVRTNLRGNIFTIDKIIHIKTIGNKLIILPTKPPTRYHIGYVVNTPLISVWYD